MPKAPTAAGRRPGPDTTRPPLQRADIIEAALHHAAHHDLAGISVRDLARQLGVTPMALYRHVRDKDDILEAVADVLLARAGTPQMKRSWKRFLEAMAQSLRAVLTEHPEIAGLITRRPLTGPTARERLTVAVSALQRAGFRRDQAVRAYAAVHTYTVGFCALEAGRRAHAGDGVDAAGGGVDEAAATIAGFVTDEQFTFGLRALLDGLDRNRP
jgi:TetR/AcrR family tetracycline transcriptional repressor